MAAGLRVPPLAKLAIVVTALYVGFVVYSVPKVAPSTRIQASPRKALRTEDKRPQYHKSISYINWKDELPDFLLEPGPHYVLFVSGTMDGTPRAMPWCGDCFACSPTIRELVKRIGGALLEVEAGSKEEWHMANNPLRNDPEAPVKYIPTLYHWTASGPGARISAQLNAQEEPANIRKIVAQFLKDTAGKSRSVVSMAQEILEKKGKKCHGC